MAEKKEKKDFSSITYSEVKTGGGQLIEFTCRPEDVKRVKSFLSNNVRSIDIPVTGRVNVPHGGFGRYTRYQIVQHKYAGGGYSPSFGGFIEVLEIKSPPDGRHGIVIHEFLNGHGSFTEWKNIKNALTAFEKGWSSRNNVEEFKKLPGFIRRVECGLLVPWFYAVGDEQLVGDFAFPEGLQDDPVYRFGRKFVVTDSEGKIEIRTCMGVRFIQKEPNIDYYDRSKREPEIFRLICWDDGTITRENCHRCIQNGIRPLGEGEIWIEDAFSQFRRLLSGKSERFEINFVSGYKFVGKVLKDNGRAKCPQGRYLLRVYLEKKKKPEEGYVDFTPTPEFPNIVDYVRQAVEMKGEKLDRVEILSKEVEKGGKKWSGVFYKLPH